MSLDEYIFSIRNSQDLPEEAKAKVITILTSRPITPSVLDEVQAIIDSEIEKEFAAAGIGASDPSIAAVVQKRDDQLTAIEHQLDEDKKFFDAEMDTLEGQTKMLDEAMTEEKINELKKDIAATEGN